MVQMDEKNWEKREERCEGRGVNGGEEGVGEYIELNEEKGKKENVVLNEDLDECTELDDEIERDKKKGGGCAGDVCGVEGGVRGVF